MYPYINLSVRLQLPLNQNVRNGLKITNFILDIFDILDTHTHTHEGTMILM